MCVGSQALPAFTFMNVALTHMPRERRKSRHFLVAPGSLASGYRRMSKTTGKASPRASGTSSPIGAALTKRRRGFQGAEVSHRASVARTKDPGTFLLSPCQTGLPGSVALAFYRGVQTDLGYFGPSSKGRIRLALLGANAHSSQSLS